VPEQPHTASQLRLRPFRGVRYNPAIVPDLAEVTSPPYDVMDRQMIDTLLDDSPRNVVRLILPRMVSDPLSDIDPYTRAAMLLERWRREAVLETDPEPAVYVYQYGLPDQTVWGVIGALELSPREHHVVLPHEDVMEPIVADRLASMSAAQANLEPIMLVYDGGGTLQPLIDRIWSEPPIVDVKSPDGAVHRLWRVADKELIAEIDRRLSSRQALIADGHHRYATYLRLQAEHRADGPGPWDRGLALLIDESTCPVHLGAIHRSISDLDLDAIVAPDGFSIGEPAGVGPAEQRPPAKRGTFVVTDGLREMILTHDGERDASVSDAELMHSAVLPAWSVGEDRVGYHHSVYQAVRSARHGGGVAVLMHPAAVTEVMEVARAGKVMPRKSTSFGPKPRTGLVMRVFADEL
jgi:uncharacterized protein (DUF1015 family)